MRYRELANGEMLVRYRLPNGLTRGCLNL